MFFAWSVSAVVSVVVSQEAGCDSVCLPFSLRGTFQLLQLLLPMDQNTTPSGRTTLSSGVSCQHSRTAENTPLHAGPPLH